MVKRLLLTALMFLFLFLAVNVVSAADSSNYSTTVLASESSGSTNSYMVVWQDSRDGTDKIYYKDLDTGEINRISNIDSGQTYPEISGDIVVWRDDRDGTGTSHLYYKDLFTGLEERVSSTDSFQINQMISGNIIVWMDNRDGSIWHLYYKDLSTGVEERVSNTNSNQLNPALSGNIVVWMDNRDGINWHLYIKDLYTGVEERVSNNDSNQSTPAISGNKIVWIDSRDGGNHLYYKNLSTSVIGRVSVVDSGQFNPSISGNMVVWQDDRDPGGCDDCGPSTVYHIYYKNLSTDVEERLSDTDSNQLNPAIAGDTIVWTDSRDGSRYHIYSENLETHIESRVESEDSNQTNPAISYTPTITLSQSGLFGYPCGCAIFQIKVQNTGSLSETNVEVNEIYPVNNTFKDYWVSYQNGAAGSYIYMEGSYNDSTKTWTIANLLPGVENTAILMLRLTPSTYGVTYTNTAICTIATPSSVTYDIYAPLYDIETVSYESNNYNPKVGDEIIITSKIKNYGPDTVDKLKLSFSNTSNLQFVSADTGGIGTFSTTSGWVWSLGILTGGQEATITIHANVISAGIITTTASHNITDINPTNNSKTINILATTSETSNTFYVHPGESIQTAINNSSSGDNILVYAGTYTENLTIDHTLNIMAINPLNTFVQAPDPNKPVFTIIGGNSLITGFVISGAGGSAGINLVNADNCQVINNIISNNLMGIYIQNSDSNTVSGNTIQNNGWVGICLDNSSSNTINNGNIITGNVEGIFIVNSSNGNTITGNNIHDNSDTGITILNSPTGNTISDNTAISHNGVIGVLIRNADNNFISGNTIQSNGWAGIALDNADGNTINGSNIITSNQEGLNITGSAGNTISGNIISSNINIGISLINSSTENIISGNTAISNNGIIGVYLRDSNTNTVSGNTIQSNGWVGVCFDNAIGNAINSNNNISGNLEGLYIVNNSNTNTITGNNIHNNQDTGIYIDGSIGNQITTNTAISNNGVIGILLRNANSNIISGNTLASNNFSGIALDNADSNLINNTNIISASQMGIYVVNNSTGNTIQNNTLQNNTWAGLVLDYTNNTTVYNNNFINNPIQALAQNGSNNTFYQGISGNYWSDWPSEEPRSIPGNDGLFDQYPSLTPF